MKDFFELRLCEAVRLNRKGEVEKFGLEGLRGWLAEKLCVAHNTPLPRATELAEEYLLGVLVTEASRIYTRSIP